jgi:hypothetical protein
MAELPVATDPVEERVLSDIDKHGWHVVSVRRSAQEREPTAPMRPRSIDAYRANFTYSVGVPHTFDLSELVLTGDWHHAIAIVNVAVGCLQDGMRFAPGDETDEILEGLAVRIGAVDPHVAWECLSWSSWLRPGEWVPALQLILPDAAGRWPDDPAYDSKTQPLLA